MVARITLLVFVALVPALTARAESQVPDTQLSSVVVLPGTNYMTPAGNGQRLDGTDGSDDTTIEVQVMIGTGEVVAGYPFQDVYLGGAAGTTLNFCQGGNFADANTNAQGVTRFVYQRFGGGSTDEGLVVYLAGDPIDTPVQGLRINSPDLNGDLRVDVVDIGLFAEDFRGGYRFRSDLVADGVVNMADVGRFAMAIGEACSP